jgi:hypothetical protein
MSKKPWNKSPLPFQAVDDVDRFKFESAAEYQECDVPWSQVPYKDREWIREIESAGIPEGATKEEVEAILEELGLQRVRHRNICQGIEPDYDRPYLNRAIMRRFLLRTGWI